MRAGAFGETRVIDLLNRRFVPFYFNTGGPGLGRDEAAADFVLGKVQNKWAHLSAFTPDGEYLGESELYADKDGVFEFLYKLLRDHPEYNAPADGEVESAKLFEELGEYDKALAAYGDDPIATARIARYRKDWDALEKALDGLDESADTTMERGYRLIAQKKYDEARALLEPAIAMWPESPRIAEMRFSAGVACWFLDLKPQANHHWCWVVENLPDDRLARRGFNAAAAEGMPYENPELGGYAIDSQFGSIEMIKAAYAKAREDYERLNR
jgi:tetratricopeptide (TPR) repeat protein